MATSTTPFPRRTTSTTFLLVFVLFPLSSILGAVSYTVVVPDSTTSSSTLIDAPQTNFAMNKNGAHTDPHEQEAVYNIMKATGNDWATDIPDVCRGRWHGIECMPDNNNVYHIVSLSFGSLSEDTAFPTCDPAKSHISTSITKLPHIRTLFFYRCFIGNPQPIPTFLGQLGSSLQTLILRENNHIGPIPSSLTNLTKLHVLDLHKNNLNGSIPTSLAQLSNLRSLDLSWNKLTGQIPSNFNFPSLVILDLSKNNLTGPIPHTIASSFNPIIKLDLSRNSLTGPIPTLIMSLKELILLDLSFNQLTGPIPTSLQFLTSLQTLILQGNTLMSGPIPNQPFHNMSSLVTLVLSNMNLHGSIPDSLGTLPRIRVVRLDRNKLIGSIPTSFGKLKDLSELRLEDNQLTGMVPLGKDIVWRMRRKLSLHNNLGLCFDNKERVLDGSDDDGDLGVVYCEGKEVQHLQDYDLTNMRATTTINKDFQIRSSKGSAKHKKWLGGMWWLLVQILVFLVGFNTIL